MLFLQINHHLRVIPQLLFQHMLVLQILDLSHTKIRYLPRSLSKLVELWKLFLRDCELFMELPLGELSNIDVLAWSWKNWNYKSPCWSWKIDILKCLKVSLRGYSNHIRRNNRSNSMIPQKLISNLSQLEEISIDVNPDDELWILTL